MSATICPSCLSKSFEAGRCGKCGFTAAEYKPPRTALPLGTVVGSYRIGLMKSNSRQSQVYTAVHTETSAPVIIEEFFPAAMVGRVQGKTEVSLVKDDEDSLQRFQQGCLLLEASAQKRPLKRLESFRANNTVYSVFEPAGTVSVAAQCEMMADNPYYFRDQNGMPMMSINLLTIPPMPKQREYNPEQYKKQAPITQPAEEDDRFAGRIITENEKRQKRNRLIITLGSIAAALVVLVGVGFGTGLVQRIVEPKPTATPIPEVSETPKPEPTATTTPEPTQAPETLDAELFAPMLRLIPAKGKELNGIPVTEGNYDPEDAELQVLDQNVIPMRVNGKKDILYAIKDELYFIVQAENEDLYRVYAGKKGENGFTPNEDLMGLGFKLWTDVKDDNQETTLKKDTLVLITKREKSIQQEENWLQALYREPSQEEESIDEADVPAAEETGTPESGEGSDGEPESTESPQDQESVQADWTISTIRLVDNIDSEKKYTPDYWSQGQQGSGDLGSSGQQIAEIEKKPGADLIIQAGIGNDKLYFHLEAISEPEEATGQEGETEKPTEGNGAEESVLPVATDTEEPAENTPEEPEADDSQQDGQIESVQSQEGVSSLTEDVDVKTTEEQNQRDPEEKTDEQEPGTKDDNEGDISAVVPLPAKIGRNELLEHMSLVSTDNEKSFLTGMLVEKKNNIYVGGGKINREISSPASLRIHSVNSEKEVLLVMSPQRDRKEIWEATNPPPESVWYYVFVTDNDKTYKVKIGKANKAGGREPEYGLPDPGERTKLVITLWNKVGDWDVGTEMSFTSGDGKMWYQGLIEKIPSLNDALKYEEAEYSIEVKTDETTGQALPELKVQMGTGSQVFELEVEGTRNLSTAGVSEPTSASDPGSQDTGSATASGTEQSDGTMENNAESDAMGEIRKDLPSENVESINTTNQVMKVIVRNDEENTEESLVRSYTQENSKYFLIWKRKDGKKIFTSPGFYTITYYGSGDQLLGSEQKEVREFPETNV